MELFLIAVVSVALALTAWSIRARLSALEARVSALEAGR